MKTRQFTDEGKEVYYKKDDFDGMSYIVFLKHNDIQASQLIRVSTEEKAKKLIAVLTEVLK